MPRSQATVSDSLHRHFTRESQRRAKKNLPEPQVLVSTPQFSFRFGDRDLPFHAASVGKLATAVLVMQEVEAGRLSLSTESRTLVPKEYNGLFATPDVTIEHLLSHTSGISDYFEGQVLSGPSFIDQFLGDTNKFWKPSDLLSFTRDNQRPIGQPGEKFSYSDTGYVLLGRILEEHTGEDFTRLLHGRIFDRCGMKDSVLWLRENGPDQIAPAWINGVEVSTFTSLSCDWAGGGIVTTLDDLHRFITACSDGTLLQQETWKTMATPQHRFRSGIKYGLGTMQVQFEGFMPLLRGLPRPTGHIGVTAVHTFINPKDGTTIVMNFHDSRAMSASFRSHIEIQRSLARLT
ncbi:serine hydrolase domain-containing protein [Flaviflexus massiliensis]|uniref:serine hydrolase domain-containing protein n=1 Tax=Flaviflexus massiliensis TaxID=1522309 RepID=UPI0006D55D8D|nr:serine hydrolase domain-containing protein [Flaviflexus massiliensis]